MFPEQQFQRQLQNRASRRIDSDFFITFTFQNPEIKTQKMFFLLQSGIAMNQDTY